MRKESEQSLGFKNINELKKGGSVMKKKVLTVIMLSFLMLFHVVTPATILAEENVHSETNTQSIKVTEIRHYPLGQSYPSSVFSFRVITTGSYYGYISDIIDTRISGGYRYVTYEGYIPFYPGVFIESPLDLE